MTNTERTLLGPGCSMLALGGIPLVAWLAALVFLPILREPNFVFVSFVICPGALVCLFALGYIAGADRIEMLEGVGELRR